MFLMAWVFDGSMSDTCGAEDVSKVLDLLGKVAFAELCW